MLTSDLLRVRRSGKTITPRYLDDKAIKRLLPAAERLVAAFDGAEGQRREAIDEALGDVPFKPTDRLVVEGLKKLLADRATFACAEGPDPAELRGVTFERAAAARRALAPREELDRDALLAEVAREHHLAPAALEERLFADLRQNEVLTDMRRLDATSLMHRYNVALAQGVLLRATRVLVALDGEEPGRVRQLFRAARFHGLLHRVTEQDEGRYLIELDGPFSLFSAVQKYGLKLASFLPAILRCRRWLLRADVLWGKKKEPMQFELTPKRGLVPPDDQIRGVAPELEKFIDGFRALDSPWELTRNEDIIAIPGRAVCVPDLRFAHRKTGEIVYLEAFGFWSRKAVWQRVEDVREGFPGRILLAVGKQLRVSEEVLTDDDAGELYVYKASMRPKAVLARLDAG